MSQTNPSETAPVEGQAPSGEQKETIKYEIGLTWTGARYNVLRVKAKPIEGKNRWDITEVLDATAMLLWKYGHNIPTVRGNKLVASWVISLLDSKDCGGTLTVTLAPYKEPQDIRIGMYIKELKDSSGSSWMIESAAIDITCSTNKYSHDIHLYFDHSTIIDKYDDKECRNECVESSLPSQAKINKVHEILLTIVQGFPLIGWYTGKFTIESTE